MAIMTTMNISLPDSMKTFIDDQVTSGRYVSSSEYVRDLIRKEQDREQLRALILEGMASELTGPMTDEDFAELRRVAAGE
jgi:antitoxin ParD1/3/4